MTNRLSDNPVLAAIGLALLSAGVQAAPVELAFTAAASDDPVADVLALVPRDEKAPRQDRDMVQKGRRFHPHVLVVPEGSTVNFPNRDNTQHHVYSFSPAKSFELELFADSPEKPVQFGKAGIVELGCNIHDHMQAFIVVTSHQRVLRSSEDGRVTLPSPLASRVMEAGSLAVWHPRMRDNDRVRHIELEETSSNHRAIQLELIPETGDDEFEALQQRFQEL